MLITCQQVSCHLDKDLTSCVSTFYHWTSFVYSTQKNFIFCRHATDNKTLWNFQIWMLSLWMLLSVSSSELEHGGSFMMFQKPTCIALWNWICRIALCNFLVVRKILKLWPHSNWKKKREKGGKGKNVIKKKSCIVHCFFFHWESDATFWAEDSINISNAPLPNLPQWPNGSNIVMWYRGCWFKSAWMHMVFPSAANRPLRGKKI